MHMYIHMYIYIYICCVVLFSSMSISCSGILQFLLCLLTCTPQTFRQRATPYFGFGMCRDNFLLRVSGPIPTPERRDFEIRNPNPNPGPTLRTSNPWSPKAPDFGLGLKRLRVLPFFSLIWTSGSKNLQKRELGRGSRSAAVPSGFTLIQHGCLQASGFGVRGYKV